MENSLPGKEYKFRTDEAKDGSMTLLVSVDGKEQPFHSRVAPAREASDPAPDPEKYDLVIVLGCGLGYGLLPMKENLHNYGKVIIIDILSGIEEDIPRNPVTGFLAAPNVMFITGMAPGEIEMILAETINFDELKGIHVREHATSFKIFPAYYSEVKSAVKRVLDRKASGAATVKAFGRRFLRNALFNLDNMASMKPVASLSGRFSGYRGLVVSSAPSIEEHIGDIAAHRDSFVLIAVDSAVPLLEKNNIVPDLAVSIDPQQRINEHFLGHEGSRTAHVFSIVSPAETVKKYGGYIFLNSHPVAQVIESIYPGLTGSIDSSTGSVAGDALALALLCGFDSIAMAGFDFSFTHNAIYARGTAYQQRYSTMFSTRLRTPESFNAEYIFRASRGFMEKGRYTRRSFTGYRDSLGAYIQRSCPGRICWISSGLVPAGVKPVNFREFMDRPVQFEKAGNTRDIICNETGSACAIDPVKIKNFITQPHIWDQLIKESIGDLQGRDYSELKEMLKHH